MNELIENVKEEHEKVQVFIENFGSQLMPEYATKNSSGCDVRSNSSSPITIGAGRSQLIPTGLKVKIPAGYEMQVRSRSGLAMKDGIFVLNSPGTIDADYRGEVKVLLFNTTDLPFTIFPGDRIAQLVLAPVVKADFYNVSIGTETERGEGGFGHSGVK